MYLYGEKKIKWCTYFERISMMDFNVLLNHSLFIIALAFFNTLKDRIKSHINDNSQLVLA